VHYEESARPQRERLIEDGGNLRSRFKNAALGVKGSVICTGKHAEWIAETRRKQAEVLLDTCD